MKPELMAIVRHLYNEEATDHLIYANLARQTKSEQNRELLQIMSDEEAKHCQIWGEYINAPPKINHFKAWAMSLLAKIFGMVFVINYMEAGETNDIKIYSQLAEELPMAQSILEDEIHHEEYLVDMLKEEKLSYISSMVLGLNDALVELTGALAGFTLALNNNTMIGLAGFITGVAATLSMASSEYLAKKADKDEKHPLKAATYTGMSYLVAVVMLLIPYAICPNPLTALIFCLINAAILIALFNFFVAVVRRQSFWRGFREMLFISFGVALLSFLIGWAARAWLNLDL